MYLINYEKPEKKKKRGGGWPYINAIFLPEKEQAVLCLVAKMWPLYPGLAEMENGRIVIPYGFFYLDYDRHGVDFRIGIEQWVESIREYLKDKEIIWEPLQRDRVRYADGHFGRPHIAAEVLHFVPFNQDQQKKILTLLGR